MLLSKTNGRWLGMGLSLLLGCLLFVASPRCEAQNLVPNHSFEEYDDCLEVNTVYYPDTGPLSWFSGGWTPDYFLSCLPYGAFNGVPQSSWAFQFPQDGEAYVGVMTYDQALGGREYFMVELVEPLVLGQTYYASFYANATWNGLNLNPQLWLASSHVGMLFTMQSRQWESGDPVPVPVNFAHVVHPWVIADTVGWTLVSGSFVADSTYRYVMIGNHFDNAITDTLHFGSYPWNPRAHTLIDNVCVSPSPNGCPLATGLADRTLDGVVFFPNPATSVLTATGLPHATRVVIHDALGRRVWTGTATDPWSLNVSEWARGSYLLRLERGSRSRSLKFMLTG